MIGLLGSSRRTMMAGIALTLMACNPAPSGKTAADTGDPDAQRMARGTDMLYRLGDPIGAETLFREVLQHNPTHYGARYQLAVALDKSGKPTEARPVWDMVLKNAEAISDTGSARVARTRLAAPDTASQDGMMVAGVDLLHRRNNPVAAAEQFRKVLERNPTHYGATYQLAVALDKAGQTAQAIPYWQKVVGMATTYKDEPTLATARQRLGAAR